MDVAALRYLKAKEGLFSRFSLLIFNIFLVCYILNTERNTHAEVP